MMEKLTFKNQIYMIFLIMGLGHLFAYLAQKGIFINIAWIICGALFLVNPVYPNFNGNMVHEKGVAGARLGGVLIIILGFLIRHHV